MRVFVAGATGAIGKQLMPRLVEAGHEVHGMSRSESKQAMLHELRAVPAVADASHHHAELRLRGSQPLARSSPPRNDLAMRTIDSRAVGWAGRPAN